MGFLGRAGRSALLCAFLFACARADAATIAIASLGSNNEEAFVVVTGPFEQGDIDQFRTTTAFLRKAVVAFASDGGNLVAGIEIGTMLRLKGFSTLVPDGARCASACAIAWLGGVKRYMGATAQVGFHAAFTVKDGVTAETSAGNALVGAYLNRIGLPDRAVVYLTQAAPGDLAMLSFQDAAKLGIDVEQFGPLQSGPPTAPSEPAQAPAKSPEPPAPTPATTEGQRFLRSACGSISDMSTGLEWYTGPDVNTAWADAYTWVLNLHACGETWSLPTSADLHTLFDKSLTAGIGYFTRGKRWPAHIDPIFSAIGEGAWLWTKRDAPPGSAFAMNLNQDVEVTLPNKGFDGTVRVFAVSRDGNTPALVVRRFYEALAVGDGVKAARLIVPEKQKGPFSPQSMSQYYSSLAEPLRLISIAPSGDGKFLARYAFRDAQRACDGQALVAMEDRFGVSLISGIKALNGC